MSAEPLESLRVELGERGYDIRIGAGLLRQDAAFAGSGGERAAALVVTNTTVDALYGGAVEATLGRLFERVDRVVLPDGEAHKSWTSMERVFDALAAGRHDRSSRIVALGGGVVGDLAGFAAATWMRGVDFVQLPTTLLAQVDSSVGGKTAINLAAGKNLVGAFHQPRLVVADVATLETLPEREVRAGLAEVLKYGFVLDPAFLDWLEARLEALRRLDRPALVRAVRRSCEIKAEVVAADEREAGVRELLNFGHTFAHAIEAETGYVGWLHGEAVGCGMVLAARLSERLGRIRPARADRIESLVARAGLPIVPPAGVTTPALLESMRGDKKARAGVQRYVLLEGEGGAGVGAAPDSDVAFVIDAQRERRPVPGPAAASR